MPSGSQVRPWVRYWARSIDFLLFCTLLGMVLGLVAPEAAAMLPDAAFGIVALIGYIFFEPLLFALFGSTRLN